MRERTLAVAAADPLQRQLEHFAALIRGVATPQVTVRDAARTLQVTLAVAAAAASGHLVRCDNMAA